MAITGNDPILQDGSLIPNDPATFLASLSTALATGETATLRITAVGLGAESEADVVTADMDIDATRTLLSLTLTVAQVATIVGTAKPGYSWARYRITSGSGDALVRLFAGRLRVRSKWDGVTGVALSAGASEAQAALVAANAAQAALAALEARGAGVVLLGPNDSLPNALVEGVLYLRLTDGSSDDTAPTTPGSLTYSAVTSTGFTVSWAASTDNTAVTGYEVRANGSTVTTTDTSYTIGSLAAATTYTVEVRARDAAGNWSTWASLDVTTAGNVTVFSDDFEGTAGTNANFTTPGSWWPEINASPTAPANTGSGTLNPGSWSAFGGIYHTGLPRKVSVRATFAAAVASYQGIFLGVDVTNQNHQGIKFFQQGTGTWVVGSAHTHTAVGDQVVTVTGSPTALRLDFDGTTVTAYADGVQVWTGTLASMGTLATGISTATGNQYACGYIGEAKAPFMTSFEVVEL